MAQKNEEYFAGYYKKNRKTISKKRQDKYLSDSSYRDQSLKRSRKNYNDKHGILSGGQKIVTSGGEEFVGVKITDAAKTLDVDRQSLLRYINLGLIPTMEFEDTKLKFITVDQLPLVKKFFKELKKKGTYKGSVQETSVEMYDWLFTNWRNRNVSEKIINKEKAG